MLFIVYTILQRGSVTWQVFDTIDFKMLRTMLVGSVDKVIMVKISIKIFENRSNYDFALKKSSMVSEQCLCMHIAVSL